ncbi:MAG: Gfo/Idh/MocA family oxidoreductase [Chloroflexota bacterium]|nr:Gfo/Idh/MocA family oxidoreductase [Chloroflexota bacterium]
MAAKLKVGFVGVGGIFPAYIRGCRQFDSLDVVACSDLDVERASNRAAEFGIPWAGTVEDMIALPGIDIVVNLTVPRAHTGVSLAAIDAGKHVHSEKPLAVTREDGQRIVEAASAKGVLVSCAPDTFLGGGQQTCRKLIDDGWIGRPVAAVAFMTSRGPESWHSNPDFFYQTGAGPLFDMGPYYLTALVNLLGPVARVSAATGISFAERVATSETQFGRRIPVEVPTHVSANLDYVAGPIATMIQSWDVWAANLPLIEVYGSEGSLSVPDPNQFGGQVLVRRAGADDWSEIPLTHSAEVGRGIGVAELANAIAYDRPLRTDASLAYHVLDTMIAITESSDDSRHVQIESSCERPAPLPLGLQKGRLDQ